MNLSTPPGVLLILEKRPQNGDKKAVLRSFFIQIFKGGQANEA